VRIAVTANGTDLDAPASPIFGRCPTYIFVETDDMQFEAVENAAIGAAGGAGIQAAQLVLQRGAQAVVTGNIGPNALDVFLSAGVHIYLFAGATVREAVEAFNAGRLQGYAPRCVCSAHAFGASIHLLGFPRRGDYRSEGDGRSAAQAVGRGDGALGSAGEGGIACVSPFRRTTNVA
jgi:predicted Fe-Mo cluster-binding NifX family protein